MSYVRERNGGSYFEVVRRVELDRSDLKTKFVPQGKFKISVTCDRLKPGPGSVRLSQGTKDRLGSPEL
jgi:hypothetical protein